MKRSASCLILLLSVLLALMLTACRGTFQAGIAQAYEPETDQGVIATVEALATENVRLSAAIAVLSTPRPNEAASAPRAVITPDLLPIKVYFNNSSLDPGLEDCGKVYPVERTFWATWSLAEAALQQLFAGPTEAERAEGYTSVFSEETRPILRSVTFRGPTAYVNLTDIRLLIPAVSSACGGQAFFAAIEATLMQLVPIDRVIYAIDGDPAIFYEWTQLGCEAFNDYCDTRPFAGTALTSRKPKDVVVDFYGWYLEYSKTIGNPMVDEAYRSSEYLSPQLVQRIDELLASMRASAGGGYDPFLCAQDFPQSIVIDEATVSGDRATVMVHTAWAGSSTNDLTVELSRASGQWQISGITCPQ